MKEIGRKRTGSGWSDPPPAARAGIWALAAVALFFCAIGSPWNTQPFAAAVITGLCMVPLAALVMFTNSAYREAGRLIRAGRWEWDSFDVRLTHAAEEWRQLLRESRKSALADAGGNPQKLPDLNLPHGLTHDALSWVQRRFVAGEELQCDALLAYLENSAVQRVDKLQRLHEYAFSIGLLGAVIGLGAQVWLTQQVSHQSTATDIFAPGFLSGLVLKAAVTVVGIMVALYARSLRWHQLERFDKLAGRIEEFVATQLGSVFREVQRRDVGSALQAAADRIEAAMKSVGTTLPNAIATAVCAAIEASGSTLKNVLGQELAGTLRREIGEPFRFEMLGLTDAIKASTSAIQETARGFRSSMDALEKEVRGAIIERDRAMKTMNDTVNVLATVPNHLEQVVKEIQESVQELKEYRGELAAAIHMARKQYPDSPGNNHGNQENVVLAEKLLEAMRMLVRLRGKPSAEVQAGN